MNTTLSKSQERYRIWLEQSKYDLEIAQISLDNRYYEWACYQSVQSVEKAIKSVVVHAGLRSPKTHKLGVLMSIANHANELFFDVKLNYRKVEAYTFVSRYPFVYPDHNKSPHEMIHKEDAETCVTVAREIYFQIEEFLSKNLIKKQSTVKVDDLYFSEDDIRVRVTSIIESLKNATEISLEKIILFGSFAREKSRPISSTMDILVICETSLEFIDRIKYVRDITKGGEPIVEPLVYTQKEFDFMLNEEGEGFLESALEEGVVIYDKNGN